MENVDFVAVLLEMRNGKVATDVSKKMNELIDSIKETGKAGKLTLTLSLRPSKADLHEGVKEISITHECKLAKPEKPIGPSVFFVDHEGGLTRTDPDQQQLFEEQKESRNA